MSEQNDKTITITFTVTEANALLETLQLGQYSRVANLIEKIVKSEFDIVEEKEEKVN